MKGGKMHRYRLACLIVAAVGIGLSIALFLGIRVSERKSAYLQFQHLALDHVAAVETALAGSIKAVESTGAIFESGKDVTHHLFEHFAMRLLEQNQAMEAIVWVPVVSAMHRSSFERAAQSLLPGYRISEFNGQHELVPAIRRKEHFPTYYVIGREGPRVAAGFDNASNPVRLEALGRARSNGVIAASKKVEIFVKRYNERSGFLLFRPVYRHGAPSNTVERRHKNLVGFALGVFVINALVDGALRHFPSEVIDIVIYDDSEPASKVVLGFWPQTRQISSLAPRQTKNAVGLRHTAYFNVGGRRWVAFLTPAEGYYKNASWWAWDMLGAGLLVTLLLVLYLDSTGRYAKKVSEQAITDPLTGLFNRRYLWEMLNREVIRARRVNSSLAAIMIDIDHFKKVNDTFGHGAGDLVLKELGTYLKTKIRGSDIACRYGGEEFMIIISGGSLDIAKGRAEEIRIAIGHLDLLHDGKSLGNITVSLGIAMLPKHANDADSLLRAADEALYEAKLMGRNLVVVSSAVPSTADEPVLEPLQT